MSAILGIIGFIVSVILAGILSWNWVEPESFGGGVVFIALWAILSSIFRWIVLLIIMGIFKDDL